MAVCGQAGERERVLKRPAQTSHSPISHPLPSLCSATAVWIANFNSSCTLHAVGEVIQEWDAAFAFPKGTSDSLLDGWNKEILTIQQDTDLEDVFKVRQGSP
jgi:hypothetical protein